MKKLLSPTSPLDSIPSIAGLKTALDVMSANTRLDYLLGSSDEVTEEDKEFLRSVIRAYNAGVIRLSFLEEREVHDIISSKKKAFTEDLEAYFEPATVVDIAERVQDLLELDSIRIK